MLKLDAEINIGDFLHWWGGQLGALLPNGFRQLFAQGYQYLLLEPDANELVLSWVENEIIKPVDRFSVDDEGKLRFQALLQEQAELAELDIILRLPNQDAVSKPVFLPEAAADNIQQLMVYELDKLTPFNSNQVYFAIKNNPQQQKGRVGVNLIVTPKNKLDGYLNSLSDWGMVPTVVDYQGVVNHINKRNSQYNLLPEAYRVKKKRMDEYIVNALAIVMVVLLFLVVALPVWMESQTVDLLNEQIDLVEQDVKVIAGYKIEIDELYKQAGTLIDSKKNQPSALAILNTVSELIADNTWLSYVKYNSGDLQFQGQSPNASSLIGSLEASDLFEKTHFVSPVTQDKKTGLERFQIATKVIRGGKNE